MRSSKNPRFKNWSYVLAFLTLIYSTLYITRPLCSFLKAATPFSFLSNTLCIVLLVFLSMAIWIKGRITSMSSYCILGVILLAYVYGVIIIQLPEEKIHFIEYGILAWLVFKAMHVDIPKPAVYVYTFLLVSVFGWIDEGIQYLLPNRYYQIADVILNSASGGLGLLWIFIWNKEKDMKDNSIGY